MTARPESVEAFIVAAGAMAVAVSALLVLQALDPSAWNQITGKLYENASMTTRVNVVNASPISCDVNLTAGWNLVSFFCLRNGIPIQEGLAPIDGQYVAVFGYDPALSRKWTAFNPSLPGWVVNDLGTLYREDGYWIYIINDTHYAYNGTKKQISTISLVSGWNLVGYPSEAQTPINQTLAGVLPSVVTVRSYNPVIPSFTYYPPNAATDLLNISLRNFSPYSGYWIYMTGSGSYSVS